jgi:hypothetical protein
MKLATLHESGTLDTKDVSTLVQFLTDVCENHKFSHWQPFLGLVKDYGHYDAASVEAMYMGMYMDGTIGIGSLDQVVKNLNQLNNEFTRNLDHVMGKEAKELISRGMINRFDQLGETIKLANAFHTLIQWADDDKDEFDSDERAIYDKLITHLENKAQTV